MDTNINPAYVQPTQAFRILQDDGYAMTVGKFSAGRLANTALGVAALVETLVFAALSTLTSPLYFVAPKSYSLLTDHAKASANASAGAFKEVLGMVQEEIQKEEASQTTVLEKIGAFVQAQRAKAKGHEMKIAAAVIGTAAVVALAIAARAYFTAEALVFVKTAAQGAPKPTPLALPTKPTLECKESHIASKLHACIFNSRLPQSVKKLMIEEKLGTNSSNAHGLIEVAKQTSQTKGFSSIADLTALAGAGATFVARNPIRAAASAALVGYGGVTLAPVAVFAAQTASIAVGVATTAFFNTLNK